MMQLPWVKRIDLTTLTVGLLGVIALVVPVATIAPAYAPPAPLDSLPDDLQGVYARFGNVELIGYQTPDGRYAPGDTVPVTVYWRVIAPDTRDLSLYLHAELEDGAVIGKVDSYSGAGTLRTTTWQAGAIYADTYGIPLDETAEGTSRLWLQVGWWHRPSEEHIPAQDESGATLASVRLMAGGFAGEASLPADLTAIDRVTFGGVITLTGYRLADDHLTLAWEGNGHPAADYTVFVQVVDANGVIVGQGDAPPGLPTHYWQAGDDNLSEHTITYNQPLATGTYRVLVGWYKPDDFTRLDSGTPDNAVVVAELQR
ncbi:MAG: hypothetical protein K8I60_01380 [Anaerolineae bacterium]|nr:hypothetical protein [Anaerolineae bacterium]